MMDILSSIKLVVRAIKKGVNMLILLLVIGILSLVFSFVFFDEYDDSRTVFFILSLFCIFISLIGVFICGGQLVENRIIEQKIAMYEEENTRIEQQTYDLICQYMEFESSTFENITPESSVTLINLYPELKSSELVSKQMDIYVENNAHIKELKEEQLNATVHKWWLYFGR